MKNWIKNSLYNIMYGLASSVEGLCQALTLGYWIPNLTFKVLVLFKKV